jgi:hypothetical protein
MTEQRAATADSDHARRELLREGVAMALYVSLSLLAVMVALPNEVHASSSIVVAIGVGVTALGLIAAHWLAFRLSTRLTYGELVRVEHAAVLSAQVAAAALVVALAAVPILVLGVETGLVVAQLLLLGLVAIVAYLAARPADVGRPRALLYALLVVGAAGVVVAIKNLVAH